MTDDAARDAALREEGRMQGLREAVKWCEAEQSVWAAQVGAYAKGSRNALVAKVRENAMKGAAAELRLLASTPDASQGSAPVAERQFPVLAGGDHKEYARVKAPGSVPWSLLAPHEEWAQRNHSQSLEKLARRGGLSMCEMVAIIEHRRWRGMTADEQMTSLRRHLAEHAASSAPPAAPQGSAAGQEAIEFSVVIAGQSHPMKLPGHAMVGHLMATAVADTGNTGQPYYECELRTLDGALIGWDQTLAQAGIRSGATLFMNPRAGVGGSQPAAPQGSPLPGGGDSKMAGRQLGPDELCPGSECGHPIELHQCIICYRRCGVVAPGNPPEGGALEGEMAEALRSLVFNNRCSRLLCEEDCRCDIGRGKRALARYDASKAIPQSGDEKEGT